MPKATSNNADGLSLMLDNGFSLSYHPAGIRASGGILHFQHVRTRWHRSQIQAHLSYRHAPPDHQAPYGIVQVHSFRVDSEL
jgi:hypothetical protein